MRLRTIILALFLLGPTAHAGELLPLQNSAPNPESSGPSIEELRAQRAQAIAIARAQCAVMLQNTPTQDRLYVLLNECYKHNAHVFRPIEGVPAEVEVVPPPYDPNRAPVFQPDPLGQTPLTR